MNYTEYFRNIKNKIEQSTEYTLRTDFENLINAIKPRKTVKIIQENKKTESQRFGKPDFMVTENDLEIGWIETKPYNDDLSVYIDKPQLKRYLNVIPNLLLTNYRDFILFKDSEPILNSNLIIRGEKKLLYSNIEKTKQIISEFFDTKFQQIAKTEKLSIILAKHAQYLHDEILEFWKNSAKTPFKEKLDGLYDLFSKTLIEELRPDEFIDAYSQTVTYGLLLSALNANRKIDKSNFIDYIPKSLSILEEIFGLLRLSNIPDGISWIIDKLFIILNNTDYTQVQKELSFAYKKGREFEDPYIYFYENFLAAYNKEKRIDRGVFYTPASVVHFIIKVTQQSLITDFKKSGLDDSGISLLDFATGTGTFLLEAFKVALENVDKGQRSGFIRNNLLNHFFGFEYLIAPYTVAHLKLTQFLQEQGFCFASDDRAKVYLTDTLDDAYFQRNPLFPYISDEGELATKVKMDEKLFVVIGNPPYSNFSRNKRPFILNLIKDYKTGLGEKKINIDDDYIKFIRFAQAKIEGKKFSYKKGKHTVEGEIKGSGQGVVGIITNNSYLSGVTHKQMRKSLLDTFDKIYLINLHGNSIIGEPDKNVFDITVGVSIAIFIKLPKSLKNKQVFYYSTLDNRLMQRIEKENFLFDNDLESINWIRLKPEAPYYWFVEKDLSHQTQYDDGWSVNKIFKTYSVGIKTKIDPIVIDFEKENVRKRVIDILNNKYNLNEIIEKYNINKRTTWEYSKALKTVLKENQFTKYDYRPFDKRYVFYNHNFLSRSRKNVMDNIFDRENIALETGRLEFIAFISDTISDEHFGGGASYKFPLYIYSTNGAHDETGNGFLFKDEIKIDNFTKEFRCFLKDQNFQNYSPEQILGYIYAILFCPAYREKYIEFFKIDFPKIPFIKNREIFEKISILGNELIENHLLKHNYPRSQMPVFAVEGDNKIVSYFYEENKQRLYINKTQYFEQFLLSVWEYKIGSYQIFDKYLKARKEKILSYEEIKHLKKVAASIKKTIEIEEAIDNLCSTWV